MAGVTLPALIRVTALADRRWRAGLLFTREPRVLLRFDFDAMADPKAGALALLADPLLLVEGSADGGENWAVVPAGGLTDHGAIPLSSLDPAQIATTIAPTAAPVAVGKPQVPVPASAPASAPDKPIPPKAGRKPKTFAPASGAA